MKDTAYIKVLTWNLDPNEIISKLNLNPDKIMIKWNTVENSIWIYWYNWFTLKLKSIISKWKFSKSELDFLTRISSINATNNLNLEFNLKLIISWKSRWLYLNTDLLKDFTRFNLNLDINSDY